MLLAKNKATSDSKSLLSFTSPHKWNMNVNKRSSCPINNTPNAVHSVLRSPRYFGGVNIGGVTQGTLLKKHHN